MPRKLLNDFKTLRPPEMEVRNGTALKILSEIENILIERGAESFSMRAVAENCKITLASLQYHYPSKDLLLTAFFKKRIFEYYLHVEDLISVSSDTPRSALENVCKYLIDDTISEKTILLYRQIYALATNNDAAKRSIESHLTIYLHCINILLTAARPDLEVSEVSFRAAAMVSLMEGIGGIAESKVISGFSTPSYRDRILGAVMDIADKE